MTGRWLVFQGAELKWERRRGLLRGRGGGDGCRGGITGNSFKAGGGGCEAGQQEEGGDVGLAGEAGGDGSDCHHDALATVF